LSKTLNINPKNPIIPDRKIKRNMLYDSPIALIDKTPIAPTAVNERCCKICAHPFKAAKSKVVGRCQNANIKTEINTQMKPYRLIENTFRRIRFQKVVTDVRRLLLLP
jgi:hypothetical protein